MPEQPNTPQECLFFHFDRTSIAFSLTAFFPLSPEYVTEYCQSLTVCTVLTDFEQNQ
jgi:hypothetical protein